MKNQKMYTTADRLNQIMAERGWKQVDILNRCKPISDATGIRIGKNDLSQYVSGKVTPGQKKLSLLGQAMNVSEAWLMGYDVDRQRTPPGNAPPEEKTVQQAKDLFLQLDSVDQKKILDFMRSMLDDPKYGNGKGEELQNVKAG